MTRRLPPAFRRPVRLIAAGALVLIVLIAAVGGLVAPYDPIALNIDARLLPPSPAHWLGSDHFGRDLFSRMLVGAGASIRVSLIAVGLACVGGIALGAAAGYFGGILDRIVSGLTEGFLAMPGILLALALIAVIGASENGVITALAIAFTPHVARVVRGSVLSLKERPYVEAARAFGHPPLYIIARHILPNAIGPITVLASSYFAQALLSESALSFLGLGVPPPHPSWGGILAESQGFMADAPWLSIFPGAAIAVTLLCINLTGDALRDHFDPRTEAR